MSQADLYLIAVSCAGIALAIWMIAKVGFHPFVGLLCGAAAIGLAAGLPPLDTIKAIEKGFGDILGGTGLVVTLGLGLGAILQISGGAHALAATTLRWTGERHAGGKFAPRTTAGAIQRYEVFLHAVGREDIRTVCEVAGPAAKQAENEGLGPCTSSFLLTFKMITPTQKKALRTATVDPKRVVVRSRDKVDIPAAAVKASVTFTEDELGVSTLEYLKNNWYITD